MGKSIGEHSLVGQALKATFRLRPPLPRYKSTFDISPVLDYVASLEPLDSLNLKMLTYKAFFLVSNCTLSRMSSVAKLMSEVEKSKVFTMKLISLYLPCIFQDCVIVPFCELEKQARPGNVRGWVQIHRFAECPALDPVAVLEAYLLRVSFFNLIAFLI